MNEAQLNLTRKHLTKSQRRALDVVTGHGFLRVQKIEAAGGNHVFVKIGSEYAPLLYAITPRGKTTLL